MAASLDDVIALAKSTQALPQEQLSRILALAPTMGEADLENLKTMIMGVQEAELKDMKAELAMREKVNLLKMQWLSDTNLNALHQKESDAQREDQAIADASLSKI